MAEEGFESGVKRKYYSTIHFNEKHFDKKPTSYKVGMYLKSHQVAHDPNDTKIFHEGKAIYFTPLTKYTDFPSRLTQIRLWRYSDAPVDTEFCIRIEKKEKVSYYVPVKAISGYLQDVFYETSEYEGQKIMSYKFQFVDADTAELMQLQLPYESSYAKNILQALPNTDLSKLMKVFLWGIPKDDNTGERRGTSLYQGKNQDNTDKKITLFYDNPYNEETKKRSSLNDYPLMKEIMKAGTKTYDSSEQSSFLENYVTKTLRPALTKIWETLAEKLQQQPQAQPIAQPKTNAVAQKEVAMNGNSFDDVPLPTDEDDLPF